MSAVRGEQTRGDEWQLARQVLRDAAVVCQLATGESVERVAADWEISEAAVREVREAQRVKLTGIRATFANDAQLRADLVDAIARVSADAPPPAA
jgi:hypothetical protein